MKFLPSEPPFDRPGQCQSTGRGGSFVRNARTPVDPRAGRQVDIRSAVAYANNRYKFMSHVEKTAWTHAPTAGTDAWGKLMVSTIAAATSQQPLSVTPPTVRFPDAPELTLLEATVSGGIQMEIGPTDVGVTVVCARLSPAWPYEGYFSYRQSPTVRIWTPAGATPDVTSRFLQSWGDLIRGRWIRATWAAFRPNSTSGWLVSWVQIGD